MGQIQGREQTRSIWPSHHFNCGTCRQRADMRTRNARGIKCPLVTRTAHMRLYAANFRSANFSSLNAHFRVTDYTAMWIRCDGLKIETSRTSTSVQHDGLLQSDGNK